MKSAICSVLLLCSACSPLQQAPLVYASKISVGVDISGTSTETPGISMSVGYKQVDAAYVPVAVAKKCEDTTPANCHLGMYDIKLTMGASDLEGNRTSGPNEEKAKSILKNFEELSKQIGLNENLVASSAAEIAAISKRQSELEAKNQAAILASSQIEAIDGELNKLDKTAPDYEQRRLPLAENKGKILATPLSSSEVAELSSMPKRVSDSKERLDSASANVAKLTQELEKIKGEAVVAEAILGKIKSSDAYSVFGRFEGANKAETNGAAVVLGKVFSTGVASQHLTRGMATYYANLGAAACFDSVAKVADKLQVGQLQLLLAECRNLTSKNDPTH